MDKKLAFITILFFVLIIIFGSKLFQKADEAKDGTSQIGEIKLCTFIPASGECRDDTLKFDEDTGDIFATVKTHNIDVSVLSAQWIYILDGAETVIAENEKELFSDEVVQLQLEKSPTRGWLEGNYRLDVQLKDKTGTTVQKSFTISSQ